jgi:UDP-glucose 4-epimerase
MKCLIFGGGGFLGLNLARALIAEGHSLKIFDRSTSVTGLHGFGEADFEWIVGDFSNEEEVINAVEGCEIIFHLISTTLPKSSNINPIFDIESNVISTIRMLEIARKSNIKMVLFASSGGTVYGTPNETRIKESHSTEPTCSYGIGKLTIEKYLHLYYELYGLNYRILRISNPYGEEQRPASHQGAVAIFLSRALNNETIEIWGDGTVIRDFIYIGDVIEAFIKAMNYKGEYRLYNVGSGKGKSINELLTAIEFLIGRQVRRNFLPGRGFDVPINVLDTTRAREILGFQANTSFEEGLGRTLNWLQTTR